MISGNLSRYSIIALVTAFAALSAGSAMANDRREHGHQGQQFRHFEHHEHHAWHEHRRHEEFRHEHPRRAEVNHRIDNQERQIGQDRRDGELSASQAKNLRQQDQSIKRQEEADVAANHGYLTGAEQAQLNKELNGVEQEIPR